MLALFAIRDADGVALVAHRAAENDAGGVGDAAGDRCGGLAGLDAATWHADVDVDEDADFDAGVLGCGGNTFDAFDGVDGDLHVDAAPGDCGDAR